MHVAFISYGLPNRETNGAPMASWAIVSHLAEVGYRVTVCSLIERANPHWDVTRARELLAGRGVELEGIEKSAPDNSSSRHVCLLSRAGRRLRWIVSPDPASLFPWATSGSRVRTILDSIGPDAIVLYHWEALAATEGYDSHVPRLMVIGDPAHLPEYYRWRMTPPVFTPHYLKKTLRMLHSFVHKPRYMKKMLAACDFKGELAAHHAKWFRTHWFADCVYLRMPIVDEVGPNWQALRREASPRGKPKILMIGDVLATSSYAGLRLFAEEVLPLLESALGPDGFEVHIVGRGEPLADLAPLLARPAVKLRGPVESAAPEFLSAHVVLIPTPIPLGVRTRAIVGFSYGCCVVAHSANAQGLPEMIHEHNALLAPSGRGLANAIIRAVRDPVLRRRLGANARSTYEENFHSKVAAGRIVVELERLVENRKKARSMVRI